MSRDMLGILKKLVALPKNQYGIAYDFLEKIADPEMEKAIKLTLRGQNPWPDQTGAKAKNTTSNLFEDLSKVELPELEEFRPADKFVAMSDERDRAKALVSIGYVDPDLQTLANKIGVEPAAKKQTMTIRRTRKQATFGQMLDGMPKRPKKVALGRVWQMVEKQGQGQEGDLLVNGYANFFLIEGTDLVLGCFWSPGSRYWGFNVYPSSISYRWRAGRQFLA